MSHSFQTIADKANAEKVHLHFIITFKENSGLLHFFLRKATSNVNFLILLI